MPCECLCENSAVFIITLSLDSTAFADFQRLGINRRISAWLTSVQCVSYRSFTLSVKDYLYAAFFFIYIHYTLCVKEMFAVVVSHNVIDGTEIISTIKESLPALVFWLTPLYFTKCRHTWEKHIVQMAFSWDIFCPKVSLNSKDMCFSLISHISSKWLIGVALLNWKISTNCKRLIVSIK